MRMERRRGMEERERERRGGDCGPHATRMGNEGDQDGMDGWMDG